MAHGGQWPELLREMLECEFSAVSGNGAEGQGGRGDAGGDFDGFALVGFLSILKDVSSKVARVRK